MDWGPGTQNICFLCCIFILLFQYLVGPLFNYLGLNILGIHYMMPLMVRVQTPRATAAPGIFIIIICSICLKFKFSADTKFFFIRMTKVFGRFQMAR